MSIDIGVGGQWWHWGVVDNEGDERAGLGDEAGRRGSRVWGSLPPIDAGSGKNVHGFRTFFRGGWGAPPPRRVATQARIQEPEARVKGLKAHFCISHTFPTICTLASSPPNPPFAPSIIRILHLPASSQCHDSVHTIFNDSQLQQIQNVVKSHTVKSKSGTENAGHSSRCEVSL